MLLQVLKWLLLDTQTIDIDDLRRGKGGGARGGGCRVQMKRGRARGWERGGG